MIGTHLTRPFQPKVQEREVEDLTELLQGVEGRTILAGDFNLTPWSWRLAEMSRHTGLARIGTWRHSWPTAERTGLELPLLLIDHIFLGDGLALEDWRLGPNIGSDHRPVIARLRLAPAAHPVTK